MHKKYIIILLLCNFFSVMYGMEGEGPQPRHVRIAIGGMQRAIISPMDNYNAFAEAEAEGADQINRQNYHDLEDPNEQDENQPGAARTSCCTKRSNEVREMRKDLPNPCTCGGCMCWMCVVCIIGFTDYAWYWSGTWSCHTNPT